jgi:hypothetical protein
MPHASARSAASALSALVLLLAACHGATVTTAPAPRRADGTVAGDSAMPARSDSSFTAMQGRGRQAMGVDQYTSSHVFEDLPDGGRIVLQRDEIDAAGTVAIRAHMDSIAAAFQHGDFTIPGFVHAKPQGEVPGTRVMAERRAGITYTADTLPRGGMVRIRTTDADAVRAVHEFLEFQRTEHHAAGHMH